jgi:hypothetical protein
MASSSPRSVRHDPSGKPISPITAAGCLITKTVTALLFSQLVDQRLIDLDDGRRPFSTIRRTIPTPTFR